MGYPRRALRLHECAKVISTQYKGRIPDTQSELRELPGIGDYTSAAIIAFAFDGRSLVLDINIRRLFARVIDGVEVPTAAPTKSERQEREELIPSKNPHVWAAATMELGALICTAKNPKCGQCPLADQCIWRSLDYPLIRSTKTYSELAWNRSTMSRGDCASTCVKILRLSKKEIMQLWDVPSQVEKALLDLA